MFSALVARDNVGLEVWRQGSDRNVNIYSTLQNIRSLECKSFVLRNCYSSESEVLQFRAYQPESKNIFHSEMLVSRTISPNFVLFPPYSFSSPV
jgi:hypothetical protein